MRKLMLVCLISLAMLTGPGCWDIRDINNRAYVSAIGLDTPEKDARAGYRVTFVIINPSGVKRQSRAESVIVQTVEAESINKAAEQLQSSISRTITLSHLRVLVIGEGIARRNFYDPGNYFEKNPDVAIRLRLMFVQKGEAQKVLQTKPRFEKSIANELVTMTQLERDFSLTRNNFFYHFIQDLRSTGGVAFGSRVLTSPAGAIVIRDGGTVFSDWKLAAWLSDTETQAANWILGKGQATVDAQMEGGVYTYRVRKKSVRVVPESRNGSLQFTVKLKTTGEIVEEQKKNLDLSSPKNISKLEQVFSRTIAGQVNSAVAKAQNDLGVDYLGFGKKLKAYDPDTFENIDWASTFPDVPVNIEVESKILNFGLAR